MVSCPMCLLSGEVGVSGKGQDSQVKRSVELGEDNQ